jgi:hypothetical protein
MRARSDYRSKVQRIADLRIETEELERKLDSVRVSLDSELAEPARETPAGQVKDARCRARRVPGRYHHGEAPAMFGSAASGHSPAATDGEAAGHFDEEGPGHLDDEAPGHFDDDRTETLVSQGRHSTYRRGPRHKRAMLITAAGRPGRPAWQRSRPRSPARARTRT